jgi:hypothetical protein
LDVGMFAFQGQRPVLRGCFLRFLHLVRRNWRVGIE